ncbi:MAG: response regulator transcription factor [Chloroflexota bacterium]
MSQPLALIIEDETDLGEIFSMALQAAGYETQQAFTGPDALTKLAGCAPDLVVLDLHLPGLDGGQVLKDIRRDARLRRTRVMLATADAAFARTLEKEADFVLLKPISFSQLRDLARRLKPNPPGEPGVGA